MAERQQDPESNGPAGNWTNGRPPRQPIFNLPAVVTWATFVMWFIHVARAYVLTQEQNIFILIHGAFIPIRYKSVSLFADPAALWTPVTYSLLHANFGHLIVNTLWLIAFGAVVARRIGTKRFVVFWILSAIASAALYFLFHEDSGTPMIGASGVISALMGAAARFAFPRHGGFNRLNAHRLPYQTLQETLVNRTVITYVLIWFAINAIAAFGLLGGPGPDAQIAWEAHVGGFLFGFFAFRFFDVGPHFKSLA